MISNRKAFLEFTKQLPKLKTTGESMTILPNSLRSTHSETTILFVIIDHNLNKILKMVLGLCAKYNSSHFTLKKKFGTTAPLLWGTHFGLSSVEMYDHND